MSITAFFSDNCRIFVLVILTGILGTIHNSPAQSFTIKPHVGYAQVSMADVNSSSRSRINALMDLTGNFVPYPDEFKGNYSGGIEISYHLENHYHLIFGTYYFRERNNLEYLSGTGSSSVQFQNNRTNELFEVHIGIKYFLRYQSWRRINFYFSGTAGFAFGWAESIFIYQDDVNSVNNKGEFSSNSITGYLSTGINLKLLTSIAIEPEIGYRFANLNQMDGRLSLSQNFNNDPNSLVDAVDPNYRTDASYDFSGFYANIGIIFSFSLFE